MLFATCHRQQNFAAPRRRQRIHVVEETSIRCLQEDDLQTTTAARTHHHPVRFTQVLPDDQMRPACLRETQTKTRRYSCKRPDTEVAQAHARGVYRAQPRRSVCNGRSERRRTCRGLTSSSQPLATGRHRTQAAIAAASGQLASKTLAVELLEIVARNCNLRPSTSKRALSHTRSARSSRPLRTPSSKLLHASPHAPRANKCACMYVHRAIRQGGSGMESHGAVLSSRGECPLPPLFIFLFQWEAFGFVLRRLTAGRLAIPAFRVYYSHYVRTQSTLESP